MREMGQQAVRINRRYSSVHESVAESPKRLARRRKSMLIRRYKPKLDRAERLE